MVNDVKPMPIERINCVENQGPSNLTGIRKPQEISRCE